MLKNLTLGKALQLSVSPSVASKAQVEAHIIPSVCLFPSIRIINLRSHSVVPSQLNLGLSLIKVATAKVFLNLDTAAIVAFNLSASASVTDDIGFTTSDTSVEASTGSGQSNPDVEASVEGCVDVKGEVSINAGAEGSFLNLFDDSTKVELFSKSFDFFQVCTTSTLWLAHPLFSFSRNASRNQHRMTRKVAIRLFLQRQSARVDQIRFAI